MSATGVEQLADAVLYEGYNLYPYRPSSLKNRHRWLFGCVLPKSWCEFHPDGDRSFAQTQCLLAGGLHSTVEVRVRFLQPVLRTVGGLCDPGAETARTTTTDDGTTRTYEPVDVLEVDGSLHYTWQEADERCVDETFRIDELLEQSCRIPIVSAPTITSEALRTAAGDVAGIVVRERRSLAAQIRVDCKRCCEAANLFRLTVCVENFTDLPSQSPRAATRGLSTATRDDALLYSLVSTHTILHAGDGEFVSSIDPPQRFRKAADSCENIGTWPVLAGDPRRPTTMLAAPIILEDFPQIAPESPGDLFDGTEIDELLSLRIRTLTDGEKREAASTDERTRQLLQRTESLDERRLESLHGTQIRWNALSDEARGEHANVAFRSAKERPFAERKATMVKDETGFQPGDRVRLRPRRRADAFDLMLEGKTAVIVSVERDFEDNVHLAVTIDDDPGKDLGAQGMPGHRFFFHPEEVEPLDRVVFRSARERSFAKRKATQPRILVAGIGNVFKGDDGFGVEVVRALSNPTGSAPWDLPNDVAVIDFGIRGIDLAFAITSGYEIVILVDAMSRGGEPGSVSVIQPQAADLRGAPAAIQGHNLDPLSVLRWASGMVDELPEVYVVGCEPAEIPGEEDLAEGLSPQVQAAVAMAVELIQNLIAQLGRATQAIS